MDRCEKRVKDLAVGIGTVAAFIGLVTAGISINELSEPEENVWVCAPTYKRRTEDIERQMRKLLHSTLEDKGFHGLKGKSRPPMLDGPMIGSLRGGCIRVLNPSKNRRGRRLR